jgi:PAS domain S-box-containing protein
LDKVFGTAMKDTEPEVNETLEEKAFSKDQLMQYAEDIGRLYQNELVQRQALEAANEQLRNDILERKKLQENLLVAERKYRTLFENSQEGIFITTRDGVLLDTNHAFLVLSGYGRGELVGSSVLKTYADPSVRSVFQKQVEKNNGVKDFEVQLRRKDGVILDCVINSSVRRDKDGSVLGYQGSIRDVTEQRRYMLIQELATKMKSLAHMAGGIAHEIRNPLAISSSAAQLLMNDRLAPHVTKECVEKILLGINRASFIVENLLTFAQPLTDRQVEQINLVQVIADALETLTSQAGGQNVQMIPQFGCGTVLVTGNRDLLCRAFQNLFLNGLFAMPEGGTLLVSVDRNGLQGAVAIIDSGKGMSSKEMTSIFDPFFKGFQQIRGIGLGLSVAHSIVSHHGGTIQVDSVLGKGSTFLVNLPLSDPS